MKWILLSGLVLIAFSHVYGDGEEENWSGCWTAFPSANTICKSEFGDEFEGVKTEGCGFLSAGKKALCRRSYAGCKGTACFSAFITDACEREFGNTLPVKKGDFDDCAPEFIRSRCCPKQ